MRRSFGLEIGTGLFVLLGIAAVIFLATQTTNLEALNAGATYEVNASFTNVGGLNAGAPVTLAGVKIGQVTGIRLDMQSLQAVVTMRISKRFDRIPADSTAAIETQGLLGDQYVGIIPGGSLDSLKGGDTIHFTQPAIVLEKLINQVMANFASPGGKN
ncbi:MAG: outer membrane lipid asymmetry maintenance protein MlaD [Gammaproteobacteria bacterium]|nr:outer membrane lipid asymmetry maintenance protein MlaD [Gammaproteobacteria bacterium]